MAQLIWTESALIDIDYIAQYISLDNQDAARRLVTALFNGVNRLEQHPLSGRKPPELSTAMYHEIIITPCRVFYRIDGDRVYILHVMRSEQQLRVFLLEEREKLLDT